MPVYSLLTHSWDNVDHILKYSLLNKKKLSEFISGQLLFVLT